MRRPCMPVMPLCARRRDEELHKRKKIAAKKNVFVRLMENPPSVAWKILPHLYDGHNREFFPMEFMQGDNRRGWNFVDGL